MRRLHGWSQRCSQRRELPNSPAHGVDLICAETLSMLCFHRWSRICLCSCCSAAAAAAAAGRGVTEGHAASILRHCEMTAADCVFLYNAAGRGGGRQLQSEECRGGGGGGDTHRNEGGGGGVSGTGFQGNRGLRNTGRLDFFSLHAALPSGKPHHRQH